MDQITNEINNNSNYNISLDQMIYNCFTNNNNQSLKASMNTCIDNIFSKLNIIKSILLLNLALVSPVVLKVNDASNVIVPNNIINYSSYPLDINNFIINKIISSIQDNNISSTYDIFYEYLSGGGLQSVINQYLKSMLSKLISSSDANIQSIVSLLTNNMVNQIKNLSSAISNAINNYVNISNSSLYADMTSVANGSMNFNIISNNINFIFATKTVQSDLLDIKSALLLFNNNSMSPLYDPNVILFALSSISLSSLQNIIVNPLLNIITNNINTIRSNLSASNSQLSKLVINLCNINNDIGNSMVSMFGIWGQSQNYVTASWINSSYLLPDFFNVVSFNPSDYSIYEPMPITEVPNILPAAIYYLPIETMNQSQINNLTLDQMLMISKSSIENMYANNLRLSFDNQTDYDNYVSTMVPHYYDIEDIMRVLSNNSIQYITANNFNIFSSYSEPITLGLNIDQLNNLSLNQVLAMINVMILDSDNDNNGKYLNDILLLPYAIFKKYTNSINPLSYSNNINDHFYYALNYIIGYHDPDTINSSSIYYVSSMNDNINPAYNETNILNITDAISTHYISNLKYDGVPINIDTMTFTEYSKLDASNFDFNLFTQIEIAMIYRYCCKYGCNASLLLYIAKLTCVYYDNQYLLNSAIFSNMYPTQLKNINNYILIYYYNLYYPNAMMSIKSSINKYPWWFNTYINTDSDVNFASFVQELYEGSFLEFLSEGEDKIIGYISTALETVVDAVNVLDIHIAEDGYDIPAKINNKISRLPINYVNQYPLMKLLSVPEQMIINKNNALKAAEKSVLKLKNTLSTIEITQAEKISNLNNISTLSAKQVDLKNLQRYARNLKNDVTKVAKIGTKESSLLSRAMHNVGDSLKPDLSDLKSAQIKNASEMLIAQTNKKNIKSQLIKLDSKVKSQLLKKNATKIALDKAKTAIIKADTFALEASTFSAAGMCSFVCFTAAFVALSMVCDLIESYFADQLSGLYKVKKSDSTPNGGTTNKITYYGVTNKNNMLDINIPAYNYTIASFPYLNILRETATNYNSQVGFDQLKCFTPVTTLLAPYKQSYGNDGSSTTHFYSSYDYVNFLQPPGSKPTNNTYTSSNNNDNLDRSEPNAYYSYNTQYMYTIDVYHSNTSTDPKLFYGNNNFYNFSGYDMSNQAQQTIFINNCLNSFPDSFAFNQNEYSATDQELNFDLRNSSCIAHIINNY